MKRIIAVVVLATIAASAQAQQLTDPFTAIPHHRADQRSSRGDLGEFRRLHAGYTLLIGDFASFAEANAVADAIRERGGRIDQVINHRVLLGVIPAALDERLRKDRRVQLVSREPVTLANVPRASDPTVAGVVRFFNGIIDGTRFREIEAEGPLPPLPGGHVIAPVHGSATAPAMRSDTSPPSITPMHHLGFDNDVMTGRIGVNVHFVESNGAVDANEFTWTSSDYAEITTRTSEGINWWVAKASAKGKTINYNIMYRGPWDYAQEHQPYEPIRRPSTDSHFWMSSIMANFGYTATHPDADTQARLRVRAYNEAFRALIGGTGAHSIFVVYNPAPAPTTHTDGHSALAHLGGPAIMQPFRVGAYPMSAWGWVYAHEMGHTYWACDEYSGECYGCGNCYLHGPRPGASNANCEDMCHPIPAYCIMRVVDPNAVVCSYTAVQIGW